MMLKQAHYAYLQTWVSLARQRLWSKTALLALCQQPLAEILPQLANQGLDDIIAQLRHNQLQLLPAGNMDALFLAVLLKEGRSMVRALTGEEREWVIYWLQRFDLQNIKAILRGKSLQHTREQISDKLIPVPYFSHLPLQALLNAEDINETLRQLEHSTFATIARHSRESFTQQPDVFTIETAINHQYYVGLVKRVQKLPTEERARLHRLLGQLLDPINLIWLLRYRLDYGLSASHSYFLLVGGGWQLTAEALTRLVQIESFAQLPELLPPKMRAVLANSPSIQVCELRLEQELMTQANQFLRQTPFGVGHVLAYLLLREKQLKHIHALLKGKLLHLPDEQIRFAIGGF
jgi:V/A-type H+-transporting ATPase subunit C